MKEVLFSQEDIGARVIEMGSQIAADYAGKTPLVVISVLRGASIFMCDLVRAIDLPLEMDFVGVSSYGMQAESSGIVRITKDLDSSIEGKHVLVAEDILDSGLTLAYLLRVLAERKPASIEVATLLLKQGAQKTDVTSKYVGFECPNEFIVGYGLDYAEQYRNLPYVGILKPEIYRNPRIE